MALLCFIINFDQIAVSGQLGELYARVPPEGFEAALRTSVVDISRASSPERPSALEIFDFFDDLFEVPELGVSRLDQLLVYRCCLTATHIRPFPIGDMRLMLGIAKRLGWNMVDTEARWFGERNLGLLVPGFNGETLSFWDLHWMGRDAVRGAVAILENLKTEFEGSAHIVDSWLTEYRMAAELERGLLLHLDRSFDQLWNLA
jgi:hypothetical protein